MSVSKTKNNVIAVLLLLACSPQTQAGEGDAIERCASLETDSDRIACLEAAIRGESATASDVAPEATPEPVAEEAPKPTADATPPTDSFGLKEKKPPKTQDTIQVTVTSVEENLRGKLVFNTANGQVWLQTGQRVARFADTPFEAEIRPASMGSYFIRATDGGVSVRVRREK